jgi:hypothetical protein
MNMLSSKIRNAELQTYPFPHIVVEDFLPIKQYRDIENLFKSQTIYSKFHNLNKPNTLSLASYFDFEDEIREASESLKELVSPVFQQAILKKLQPFIGENLCKGLKERRYSGDVNNLIDQLDYKPRSCMTKSKEDEKASCRNLFYDVQFGVNSPAGSNPTSVRDIHIDHSAKLYNALLYFRDENDRYAGGDLCLYRFRKKSKRLYNENALRVDTRLSKVIQYKSNTFVLFVNGLESLHGVVERVNTDVERRYLNILARTPYEFLDLKSRQGSKLSVGYLYEKMDKLENLIKKR